MKKSVTASHLPVTAYWKAEYFDMKDQVKLRFREVELKASDQRHFYSFCISITTVLIRCSYLVSSIFF